MFRLSDIKKPAIRRARAAARRLTVSWAVAATAATGAILQTVPVFEAGHWHGADHHTHAGGSAYHTHDGREQDSDDRVVYIIPNRYGLSHEHSHDGHTHLHEHPQPHPTNQPSHDHSAPGENNSVPERPAPNDSYYCQSHAPAVYTAIVAPLAPVVNYREPDHTSWQPTASVVAGNINARAPPSLLFA